MRYLHVLAAFATMPWALEESYLRSAVAILAHRAAGGLPSTEARAISDTKAREVAKAEGGVAVMPIMGLISQRVDAMDEACGGGGMSVEKAQRTFRALRDDSGVKAIILNVDSPGGSPAGVDEFAREIREARGIKPIIAQVNSNMASAAYWIGAAADEIVVTPGGLAGSIGVYSVHQNISEALAKAGISPTLIRAGEFKAETNGFGPLSDAGREQLEMIVEATAAAFRDSVAESRGITRKAVIEKFGDGKVFPAAELVARGMADRIATLDETLTRYGVPTKRQSGAAATRQAFARSEVPTMREFEHALGDLGLSNSAAEQVARAAYPIIAKGEPGPASDQPELTPAAAETLRALAGYKFSL